MFLPQSDLRYEIGFDILVVELADRIGQVCSIGFVSLPKKLAARAYIAGQAACRAGRGRRQQIRAQISGSLLEIARIGIILVSLPLGRP